MRRAFAIAPEAAGLGPFPPRVVVEIKALACERPADLGPPLARLSVPEIAPELPAGLAPSGDGHVVTFAGSPRGFYAIAAVIDTEPTPVRAAFVADWAFWAEDAA